MGGREREIQIAEVGAAPRRTTARGASGGRRAGQAAHDVVIRHIEIAVHVLLAKICLPEGGLRHGVHRVAARSPQDSPRWLSRAGPSRCR